MQANGLPNTFVPGRNLLFLTFAAALAYRRGASVLVGGMCETDYSGYPDCRDNTLKALQVALSLGLDAPMTLREDGGLAERLEPVVRGVDLGVERQVHHVAGNNGEVWILLTHVAHEAGQTIAIEGPFALDLPVQIAGNPLAEQFAGANRGQGRQMDIGEVGEGDHCLRLMPREVRQ